jgi:acetyl-CoA carboxylase/biotin carboxylase 1
MPWEYPLYNILKSPPLRKAGTDKNDFLKKEYTHRLISLYCRLVTAENPGAGFKPTSGIIERIKFQSTSSLPILVWSPFRQGRQ